MLFAILLTVQILICLAMGALILVQQSEGGALGMGGGPSGFMSARGAGNLLTRMTGILAFLFFANCIGLTIVGNMQNRVRSAVDQADMSNLTLPVNGSSASAAAAAAFSASSAPSLTDLPLGAPTPAPATAAPQTAPVAGSSGALTALPPPVSVPHAATSSKQVEAAKDAIWKSSASGSAPAAKPASASASSAAK